MKSLIKKCILLFVAFLCVFLTMRSLFHPSFFPIHDFTHVARLVEMDKAITDGHVPVRWTRDFGYGYGMPLFNFYGPTPFYVAEIFHVLGFSALTSIKLLLFTIAFASFFGMYAFTSKKFGMLSGLLSSIAFVTIPYRAVDIFVRGAFNELFALSCVPIILYAIEYIKDKKNIKGVGFLAIALTLLFTSHNLMTMMFVPFIYAFGLLNLVWTKDKKIYAIKLHASFLLAVMLSSFYLLPSYLEKGYTQVDKLIGGYGAFFYHFLYIRQFFTGSWGYGGSILGIYDGLSFQIGWIHILLMMLGFVGLFIKGKHKIFSLFFSGSIAVSLFLTTFKSQWIWEHLPLIQYIQFPWRFLSVVCVFAPLLSVGVLLLCKRSLRIPVFIILSVVLLSFNLRFFAPEKFLDTADSMYYTDSVRIQKEMSSILPDYIPKTVESLQEYGKPRVDAPLGYTIDRMQILVDRTHEMLIDIGNGHETKLLFRIYAFPGWTIYVDGERISYEIEKDTGFMIVPLTEGNHLVSVSFEDTQIRTISNIISLLGIVTLGVTLLYDRRRRSTT